MRKKLRNALLFNLTMMDAKETRKRTLKVNVAQKIFLIDYLWANSKLLKEKWAELQCTILFYALTARIYFFFLSILAEL